MSAPTSTMFADDAPLFGHAAIVPLPAVLNNCWMQWVMMSFRITMVHYSKAHLPVRRNLDLDVISEDKKIPILLYVRQDNIKGRFLLCATALEVRRKYRTERRQGMLETTSRVAFRTGNFGKMKLLPDDLQQANESHGSCLQYSIEEFGTK